MLSWLITDFETSSALNLKQVGAWRYAEDPTTDILCMCYSYMGGPWEAWFPGDPVSTAKLQEYVFDPDVTFISFGDFERAIWRLKMPELGLHDLPNSRWHDIQAVAAMKQMPKNVEKLALVLGLPEQKDMEGRKITLSLSKVKRNGSYPERTPEIIRRVSDYCGTDIQTELAAHSRLGWLPPGERSAWLLNQRINERGIRLDREFIAAAQTVVDQASKPLIAEFRELTGINPTQRDKLLAWLHTAGVDVPNLNKQTMSELLGSEDDDYEEVEGALPSYAALDLPANVFRALEIRKLVGSASIKKLAAMDRCICADGRARGLLQYHGTGPGRSAGRLLQPQNFPKPIIEGLDPDLVVGAIKTRDAELVEDMCGGPAIQIVAGGLRQAITCNPDRILVSGDYAGIQARLVLSVAGQHDKAAMMAAGLDIYCDCASQIYKRPIDKKKDPKERGTGKNAVLGLGFQMGAETFQSKYAREQPLDFCDKVVRVYRKEWAPKVPLVWYALEDAAVQTVWSGKSHSAYGVEYALEDGWLTCRLPSGRKMWYWNPQKTRRPAPWDADDIKAGFTYQALKMNVWRTIDAFGGQLTENVIMGMEADIMRKAQMTCEKNGFPICMEVHDEVVAEPLKVDADFKAFEQILLDVDEWAKHIQVPIAVEGWVGERYRK